MEVIGFLAILIALVLVAAAWKPIDWTRVEREIHESVEIVAQNATPVDVAAVLEAVDHDRRLSFAGQIIFDLWFVGALDSPTQDTTDE